jgi:hypothetical protein
LRNLADVGPAKLEVLNDARQIIDRVPVAGTAPKSFAKIGVGRGHVERDGAFEQAAVNAAWGQMMRPPGAIYGSVENTLLNYTRYDKVVEALGGHGEHVERPEELRPALERAAASGKPACVNVVIRQDRDYAGGIYV